MLSAQATPVENYSAPPSAAIVDRNCFSMSLYSARTAGEPAFIRVASYYPVHMFSQVRTLARGAGAAQYCELDVMPGEVNRFTLTGCMTQCAEPLPLAFAIQDGTSYAGAILLQQIASGHRMAFVQYLSGYAVPPADQRAQRVPLVRFESRL